MNFKLNLHTNFVNFSIKLLPYNFHLSPHRLLINILFNIHEHKTSLLAFIYKNYFSNCNDKTKCEAKIPRNISIHNRMIILRENVRTKAVVVCWNRILGRFAAPFHLLMDLENMRKLWSLQNSLTRSPPCICWLYCKHKKRGERIKIGFKKIQGRIFPFLWSCVCK